MKNIITHSGLFHADEVFACAAINIFMNEELNIIRTRDEKLLADDKFNKDRFLVDVGGIYDEKYLCFDHHQDASLEASNILVFNWLYNQSLISSSLYEELLPFMEGISDFDTNHEGTISDWLDYNYERKFRNISNIISGFNRDPRNEELQMKQFNKAVEFAVSILENETHSANERIKAKSIYDSREVLSNNVAIFPEFCSIWKDTGDHKYAILPNPQGWSLNSINSDKFPLPLIEHKDLIFAHKGRFIAVFKTKKAAEEVALSL